MWLLCSHWCDDYCHHLLLFNIGRRFMPIVDTIQTFFILCFTALWLEKTFKLIWPFFREFIFILAEFYFILAFFSLGWLLCSQYTNVILFYNKLLKPIHSSSSCVLTSFEQQKHIKHLMKLSRNFMVFFKKHKSKLKNLILYSKKQCRNWNFEICPEELCLPLHSLARS